MMKMNHFRKNATLVCVGLGLFGCTQSSYAAPGRADTAPQAADTGITIAVHRTPSVGSGVFVGLSVDGKRVKTLMQGSHYHGTLSPGKHVISVTPDPNTSGQRPNTVEFVAEKGHAYSFSASRSKSGEIVLIKTS